MIDSTNDVVSPRSDRRQRRRAGRPGGIGAMIGRGALAALALLLAFAFAP